MLRPVTCLMTVGAIMLLAGAVSADVAPVPIVNGDFSRGADEQGVPTGWQPYGGSETATLSYVAAEQAVILDDRDGAAEVGITQGFPAQPGIGYEVRVKVRAFADRPSGGAFLQVIFMPSGEFAQVGLATSVTEGFKEIAARGLARADIHLHPPRPDAESDGERCESLFRGGTASPTRAPHL